MTFIINPGLGPVLYATESQAISNINLLLWERFGILREYVLIERKSKWDEEGRYGFKLTCNGKKARILMPGIKPKNWNFVRMFINGSSWEWKYAVEILFEGTMPEQSPTKY